MGLLGKEYGRILVAVLSRRGYCQLVPRKLLNGLLDKSVPLSSGEYSEWGNPESGEHYSYIKSYSPYDNIRKASYPDLLVTADLSDNRSPFWMAAKWVARIRATAKAGTFIALQTRMGNTERSAESSPRDSFLKQRALQLAFIIDRLGIGSKEKAAKN